MNKAVFVDKDGTLIENVPYNIDPTLIRFYPEVERALKFWAGMGYKIVIVSNQPGVALGLFDEREVEDLFRTMQEMMITYEIPVDGFYYCPHFKDGTVSEFSKDCTCRKPKPGMLLQAAKDLNIDPRQSWMIGDILNDVEAGNRAGCKTIMIDNGNETEWVINEIRKPLYIVKDLWEAATKTIEYDQMKELQRY